MSVDVKTRLLSRGVEMPFPDQVAVAPDVLPERIEAGARLEPGSRIEGPRTLIRAGASIGSGGPVLLRNCALGRKVDLASGSFEGALFLDGARFGPAAHVRAGTLFEEGASAAHAVGTKQTILLPFATLGSNVNFCDTLLAGGTGREAHSEVGSGFVHFNFTPFGPRGDKATPSAFGDVVRGVWLREARIFLGGSGGVVGPIHIGFGSVLAAGSVYRSDRGENVLVLGEALPGEERPFDMRLIRRVGRKVRLNLAFMAQLVALDRFYECVRLPLATGDHLQTQLVEFGRELLQNALDERARQLQRMLAGLEESVAALRSRSAADPGEVALQERLIELRGGVSIVPDSNRSFGETEDREILTRSLPSGGDDYLGWVAGLDSETVGAGRRYLEGVVAEYLADPDGAGRFSAVV